MARYSYRKVYNSGEDVERTEADGTIVYSYNVKSENVALALIFYQLYTVVNQSMMLVVCHKILQYIRNSLEKKEELYISAISND